MESVFKALADGNRRRMLDLLFEQDGQTVTELARHVTFSRQALSKHLRILEDASLIVTAFRGREKQHFLNPIPIQEIADRWLAKYRDVQLGAVTALKRSLETGRDADANTEEGT